MVTARRLRARNLGKDLGIVAPTQVYHRRNVHTTRRHGSGFLDLAESYQATLIGHQTLVASVHNYQDRAYAELTHIPGNMLYHQDQCNIYRASLSASLPSWFWNLGTFIISSGPSGRCNSGRPLS